VQYPEYRKYSADYAARICVDISFAALRAARRQLGEHGIYVLGDITNLPLRDNAVDGCVSLHTIYHVPASEQAQAFHELHRVLKPGGSAAVVYSWKSRAVKLVALPAKLAELPVKLWRSVRRNWVNRSEPQRAKPKSSGEFYYHAYSYRWFVRQRFPFATDVRTWRSVNIPILKAYFHDFALGRAALAALFWLEDRFPRFLGRFGAYPLIVIKKRL
jgi:ubiquinone/menaquinone biosynthesis C-methylase UbiE